jgi:hypothetical protein
MASGWHRGQAGLERQGGSSDGRQWPGGWVGGHLAAG